MMLPKNSWKHSKIGDESHRFPSQLSPIIPYFYPFPDEIRWIVPLPSIILIPVMLGYTADELVGQDARMLYPSDEEYERIE